MAFFQMPTAFETTLPPDEVRAALEKLDLASNSSSAGVTGFR
jgi:hypothetical protein